MRSTHLLGPPRAPYRGGAHARAPAPHPWGHAHCSDVEGGGPAGAWLGCSHHSPEIKHWPLEGGLHSLFD